MVTVKNSYGNLRVYPACKTAHLLTDLSSSATVRESDIRAIKALGYAIEQVAPEKPAWL